MTERSKLIMNTAQFSKFLLLLSLIVQLSGCASPAQRIDEQAITFGYRKLIVSGEGFDHVVYLKPDCQLAPNLPPCRGKVRVEVEQQWKGTISTPSPTPTLQGGGGQATTDTALHVYLEGDGSPWLRKRLAASDPTPRNALMFELMHLDKAPSLYLGRPCYHGLNKSVGCTPLLWTDQRYSPAVVNSMARALQRITQTDQPLILFGYSGGGTLAMLLAEQLPQTRAIVTVAANLDTDRWAALHKQQALSGSLNPATRPPLPAYIKQLHIAGERDNNVPPNLIREAIAHQPGAIFNILPHQEHRCCWREVWPDILRKMDTF